MGPEAIFVSVLAKFIASASISALKAMYGSLAKTPAFSSAILSTQKEFQGVEVEASLRKWCESPEFDALTISLKDGTRLVADSEVVASYINNGQFFNDENTEGDAGKILTAFFRHLELAIYSSSEGTAALARREEVLHQETRSELKQALAPVSSQLVEVSSELKTLKVSLADKSITPHEAEEKVLHARIDEAHKLIKKGKCTSALSLLNQLRTDITNKNASKSVLYRLSTNIGYCHHILEDVSKANDEFLLAYKLEPANRQAISNYAAVSLQRGRPEEALQLIEKCGKIEKAESALAANYITTLLTLKKEAEFGKFVSEQTWVIDDADCCFAIGKNMFEDGKFDEAEKYLRKSNSLSLSKEPRTLTLLAHCLIKPTQLSLHDQPILRSQFTDEFKLKLNEANGLLSRAVEILTDTDDVLVLANALTLRADTKRMIGDDSGAIDDCDAVLAKKPNDETANQLKGICCLHNRSPEEAIKCFETIVNEMIIEKIFIPFAAAYFLAGKHNKVIDLVTPRLVNGILNKQHIIASDFLISAYLETANDAKAESIVSVLKEKWPNNSDALIVLAHYYQKLGKTTESENAFLEALSYATDLERPVIELDLAEFYFTQNNFSKAANLYHAFLGNTSDNSGFNQRYLACLYNSGSYKEAFELARRIRNEGEPLKFVSQIEANILIEFGDLTSAITLLEGLAAKFPEVPSYRIEAAQCAYRRVKHNDARKIIASVKYEDIRKNSGLLMRVAQLRVLLGMDDVLRYAYQARRAAPASPEVQAAYTMVVVNREGIDLPPAKCESCGIDTSIILKTPDGNVTYTILDEPDVYTERGELSVADARAMGLIGKKRGDVFPLRKNAWQEYTVEVLEILNKYAWAFQETLNRFSTNFPTSNLIQPVRGEYEQFRDGFFKQLDSDQIHTQKVVAAYKKMQITLEMFAELCGKSVINTWGFLVGGHYTKFISHTGTVEDQNRDIQDTTQADSVVLEITSILTLSALGVLEKLPARFKNIYCTQAVLDELNEYIIENASGKGGLSIGKIGENYVKEELSPEDVRKRRVYFEKIRDFLIQKTTITPIMLGTDDKEFKWNEMKKVLGPISTASVLAAKEHAALLLSEDIGLRALARNEWRVAGAWTQTILVDLRQKRIITDDEYCDGVVKLALLNFKFVSVNAEVIMWLYGKKQFQQSSEMKKLYEFFRGPDCSIDSAIGVLSDVVKRVWLESLLYENKLKTLEDVLSVLVDGRPLKQTVELFLLVLKERFYLLQNAYAAIEKYVNIWRQQQMNRSGLSS